MLFTIYNLRCSALIAGVVLLSACGGSGGTTPPTTPGPGGSTTTITITSAGTSPRNVTVDLGTRIRWVNNDNRAHEMSSDPHPEHNICPEFNSRVLGPGQQHETNNLVTARACGYHDHLLPDQANLIGTITIR